VSYQRLLAIVLCAACACVLASCDRSDHAFGEGGVVRIGIAIDQIVAIPSGEAVEQSFVVGHRPGTGTVLVANVDQDGRTLSTAALPSSFTTPNAHAAVIGWREPRDPDVRVDVAGVDATGHLAVAQTFGDALNTDYGVEGIAPTDIAVDPDTAPLIAADDDGTATVIARRQGHDLFVRLSPGGELLDVSDAPVEVAIQDVEPLDDGGTIAAGIATVARRADGLVTKSDFAVLRLAADGNLDPTFGTDGVVTVSFGDIDRATSVVHTNNGGRDRIVVAGTTADGVIPKVALASLNPDGSLDGSFGLYARSVTDAGVPIERVDVAAGQNHIVALTEASDVLRSVGYTLGGVLDDAWGDHGFQRTTLGGGVAATGLRPLSLRCLHGVCTGDWRFLIAARTDAGPGGALVRLVD
jgi:hypothetical protein